MNLDQSRRISARSAAQFDSDNWLKEGDGLLASSVKMRDVWSRHRETFSKTVRVRKMGGENPVSDWNLLEGLPRASMLLLGYSVEMYLKAGLVKAYWGCSERMFERDVKGRFGHNLVHLANEIDFALKDGDGKNFDLLKDMILVDARYPVFVQNGETFPDVVNRQTGRIWSSDNFEAFAALANRVKEHSRIIDKDRKNPAWCESVTVDDDGYLTFRVGGNLPPRITYCLSTAQKCNCETSLDDIKALLVPRFPLLISNWDHAWIYEDGENKTSCRAQPSR